MFDRMPFYRETPFAGASSNSGNRHNSGPRGSGGNTRPPGGRKLSREPRTKKILVWRWAFQGGPWGAGRIMLGDVGDKWDT